MQLNTVTIDRKLVAYNTHRIKQPERWRQFERLLSLSWLYHDQAMEGISLSEQDIKRALDEELGRHYSEGQLFARIRRTASAIERVQSSARRGRCGEIDLEALKGFHAMLTQESDPTAGRYRKDESAPAHYTHDVTRPPSISYRLRKLVETIGQDYSHLHPIRGAALIHHEFMTIWPFDDRTGTAGRLLLNGWLMRAKYPPAIIHANTRQEYFKALTDDPEETYEIVLDAVATTLKASESFFAESRSSSTLVA